MLIKRNDSGGKPINNVRDLERRLRDVGCSRSQAKKYVAHYRAMQGLTEAELRDAAYQRTPTLETKREAAVDGANVDVFEDLMSKIQKQLE